MKKPLVKLTYQPFNFSTFKLTNRIFLNKTSTNTAFKQFKLSAMAEMSYQFNFDKVKGMETQPIYLFKEQSENTTPCLLITW